LMNRAYDGNTGPGDFADVGHDLRGTR
jgi:hypothetical protein